MESTDRAAQAQAKSGAATAGEEAGQLFGQGEAERAALFPFLRGELTAQHAFTPTQLNEMLTYAGAGAGGATGAFTGEAELEAARTRNPAGFQAALERSALGRQQALAKASEGIAAQDVQLTEQNRQRAAEGLAGLYGADIHGALGMMGIQQEAIKNEIEAGKSGWFQNLTSFLETMRKGAETGAAIAKGGS